MIEPLDGMPEGTLGFALSGEVSKSDYEEVLIPPLRETIEAGGEVRCLCRLGPEFEGYEAPAVWEDFKTGAELGVGHHSAWKRMALVTNLEWARHLVGLFGWLSPGELKLFSLDQIDQAKAWVAEWGPKLSTTPRRLRSRRRGCGKQIVSRRGRSSAASGRLGRP